MESYTVIRANRRTVGLRLDKDGRLVVRAPYFTSEAQIRRIVEKESAWLAREHERFAARQAAHPEPDEAQRRALIEKAKTILPPKIEHYAALMGVRPARVTITGAHPLRQLQRQERDQFFLAADAVPRGSHRLCGCA